MPCGSLGVAECEIEMGNIAGDQARICGLSLEVDNMAVVGHFSLTEVEKPRVVEQATSHVLPP